MMLETLRRGGAFARRLGALAAVIGMAGVAALALAALRGEEALSPAARLLEAWATLRDGAVGWAEAPLQALTGALGAALGQEWRLGHLWRDIFFLMLLDAPALIWTEAAIGASAAWRALLVAAAAALIATIGVGLITLEPAHTAAFLAATGLPVAVSALASAFLGSNRLIADAASPGEQVLTIALFTIVGVGVTVGLCAIFRGLAADPGDTTPIVLALAASGVVLGAGYLEFGGVSEGLLTEEMGRDESRLIAAICLSYGGLTVALHLTVLAGVTAIAALGAL